MWLLNFYNKYYLCGSEGKIHCICRESLYLPIYLEISKIPLLSNCHGEIFVETAVLVKKKINKIAIVFFNCTYIYLQSCSRDNLFKILVNPVLFLYVELRTKPWL